MNADISRVQLTDGRRSSRAERLRAWLTHRRLPILLALLAILLTLPSLWVGWVADDHYHRLRLVAPTKLPGLSLDPTDLFVFAGGDLEENARLIDLGCWPWWSVKGLRAAFWRPLAVLTHRLDYWLWPEHPMLMHVQSVLWYGALVAVATLLYRRIMGITWLAGLAALLYTIDDARGMAVGFLANRNAVVAALFGVLAILAHVRWRSPARGRWAAGVLVGPGLLLASLLSAEAGLGALAYIFAYSVCIDRSPWRRRLLALLPYAIVVAGWRFVWSHLGYGIKGIGLYVDPLTEPLHYLVAVLQKVPLFLLGQWALPPSELYVIALELDVALLFVLVSVVLVGAIAVVTIPMLRNDATTRFWALGMILSLAPICASLPGDRMLCFVGLGAFALIAQYLSAVIDQDGCLARQATSSLRRIPTVALGVFFLAVHGVLAPIGLALRSGMPFGPKSFLESVHVHLPMDASVEQQSVVIVNAPIVFAGGYLPIRNAVDGLPVPAHTRTLAPNQHPIVVTRPDVYSLVVRPAKGFLNSPWDRLGRNSRYPMALGERVELTGMTAEVTALNEDNRPAEVTFRFTVPLEDASLRWLYWTGSTYASYTPPRIGETAALPAGGAAGTGSHTGAGQ